MEDGNVTAPMVEVSGPEGPMMVFRPWTAAETREAMAHLPDVSEGGDKLSEELIQFCEEFSPTMAELKRLLLTKLGPTNWYKVKGRMPADDCKRRHCEWDNQENYAYHRAVGTVAHVIRETFPTRIDMSKVSRCQQEKDEKAKDYYSRLHEIFNKFSGLVEPADRGQEPGTWECHLRNAFLDGLKPEVARKVKASCLGWREGRLATVLTHAMHVDGLLREKQDKRQSKGERDLQLTLAKVAAGVVKYEPRRDKRKTGGKGKSGRGQEKAGRFPQRWSCGICETNEHEIGKCSKCRLCRQEGHWARNCPEAKKTEEDSD
ncbi:hypothetical protein QQF64_029846 [Cirrhinus molitorella]|uniref:CCHC-type domain-containing protein n=1 Tax=Cirrhinus molitorella TaxID=172907 RepID=A0ABR3N1N1_9TELE